MEALAYQKSTAEYRPKAQELVLNADSGNFTRYARITGLLYLVIIVCGMSSGIFVRETLIVAGDATATAQNIISSPTRFRLGFVADLLMVISDVAVALLFYFMLKQVNKTIAMLATFFRLIQSAILGVNLLNYFTPLLILSGSEYLNSFSADQLNAQALLHLKAFDFGYLISGVFFGFNCLFMGYLLLRSKIFPSYLGGMLVVAAFGYLLNSMTNFVAPQYASFTEGILILSALTSELAVCFWLLFKGFKTSNPQTI